MLSWLDWEDHETKFATTYVEWFHDVHVRRRWDKPEFVGQAVPRAIDDFDILDRATSASLEGGAEVSAEEQALYRIMAPRYLTNTGFLDWWKQRPNKDVWLPPADKYAYPKVDEDTLVAGIIDVGIAFGHRRFRLADGRTRVLGAWQQGAPVWDPDGNFIGVPHLPFGTHQFEADINGLLDDYSLDNDLTAPLDQDGFNRAAGLLDFATPDADRLLAQRAAHGTHVLGILGGADPDDILDRKFSRNVRILAVSLPPAFAYGEGGAFLDYYLIYALRWIIEANVRIAEASGLDRPRPMITNISFGKHAGSKDEAQPFVEAIGSRTGRRKRAKLDEVVDLAPFHATLPAGNSNLDRGHTQFKLGTGKASETELDWVVQPGDATSNFLELWCVGPHVDEGEPSPLEIELVPPGQMPDHPSAGKHGQIKRLTESRARVDEPQPLARIYCERIGFKDPEYGKEKQRNARFRYLICLAPDRYSSEYWTTPPAGRWRLRLYNAAHEPIKVRAMVQTDQSTLPGVSQARRSYLDDPTYERFVTGGRVRDTYEYTYPIQAPVRCKPKDLDTADLVRRHGTLNSYAANSFVATIAGYRVSDGRPAPYSSSGTGKKASKTGRGAPTVCLPSDDGYAHPGVLSDGASDGASVAMRGTSFASPAAARLVLNAWLDGEHDPYGDDSIKKYLFTQAKYQPPLAGWFVHPVDIEKVGGGRLAFGCRRTPRL